MYRLLFSVFLISSMDVCTVHTHTVPVASFMKALSCCCCWSVIYLLNGVVQKTLNHKYYLFFPLETINIAMFTVFNLAPRIFTEDEPQNDSLASNRYIAFKLSVQFDHHFVLLEISPRCTSRRLLMSVLRYRSQSRVRPNRLLTIQIRKTFQESVHRASKKQSWPAKEDGLKLSKYLYSIDVLTHPLN